MRTAINYQCLPPSILLGVSVLLSGCGSGTAQISGKITHNGQQVPEAEVILESPDENTQQFFGMTTEDGTLYVGYRDKSGVPPGPWKIHVTHYTLRDGQPLPGGEAGQALRASGRVIAKTYIFDRELNGGKNVLDLKLESATNVENAPRG